MSGVAVLTESIIRTERADGPRSARPSELSDHPWHPEAQLYGVDPFENYDSLNSFYLLMDKPEVYGLPSDPVTPTKYMPGDYLRGAATLILCAAAIAACLV